MFLAYRNTASQGPGMKLPTRHIILISFAISILFVSFMGFTLISSIHHLQASTRSVEHTYQVIQSLEKILLDLGKMEKGLRGFLLTREPEFLSSYRSGLKTVYKNLDKGQKLTSDSDFQQENFRLLHRLIDQKIGYLQGSLNLAQAGDFQGAMAQKQVKNIGKKIMDNIEPQISNMEHFEFGLLAERKIEEAQSSKNVLNVFFAGSFLTVFFFGLALYLLVRQIRERETFVKLVQKNEHQLFQFLEAVPVGIFVLDADGRPYYSNQAAKEILGQGILKNIGLEQLSESYRFYLAETHEFYPSSKLPMVRAMFGDKSQVDDLEIRRLEKTIPLQVWGTPAFDEKGTVKYVIAAFIDITERREIEEMKNDLISIVSHQLKTPVGEINGYIENLLDGIAGDLNKKQLEYLTDMRDIGQDNYRLINDLLNVSKIERGVLAANIETVTLEKIGKLAVRDYESRAKGKGLSFTLNGIERKIFVRADLDKTVETVRNLINNALKCTDKGGIAVHLKSEGLYGVIEVRDTGIGMTEEVLGRLFTKNRIMGKEASRSGAGIGLFIAQNFMKLQDSTITVTSKVGEGTCFTLKIPMTGSPETSS
jgi:PAS domain S-box-containing protein